MSDYQEEIIERLLNLIDFMEDKVAELEERENQLRKSFSDKCDELTLTPQFIIGIGIDQSTPPDPNTIQCNICKCDGTSINLLQNGEGTNNEAKAS